MSDEEDDTGFVDSIKSSIGSGSDENESVPDTTEDNDSKVGEYVGLLKELSDGNEEEETGDDELDFVVRSSSPDVIRAAYKRLEAELDEDEEIPFDAPRAVVLEAERQLAEMRDPLVHEVEQIHETEEGSVTGAEVDTMLYLESKHAGRTGNFTVLGGAESLIYNIGQKNDWHPLETKLVLYAQEEAARRNNLERHLLLDIAIIIPNDSEIVEEDIEQEQS